MMRHEHKVPLAGGVKCSFTLPLHVTISKGGLSVNFLRVLNNICVSCSDAWTKFRPCIAD